MNTMRKHLTFLKFIAVPALYVLAALTGVAQGAEYRIIIGDANACRAAGASGSDCLIKVVGTTSTASSATTSSASTTSSGSSSSGDCVVTTWNNCAGSGGSTTGTGGVISSNTSPTTTTTTTTTTTSSSPPPSSTVAAGSRNYGSGGSDATGKTTAITLNGNITALPFTTATGPYLGKISMVETSAGMPTDGSGVRAWLSTSQGGAPLSGSFCAQNWGFQGAMHWDQTGTLGYACQVPNSNSTLYLNLQLCISARTDKTCTASNAKISNETAQVYLYATKRRN